MVGSLSFYFVSSLAEMHLIKNGALWKFQKKKKKTEEPKRVGLKCQQTATMRETGEEVVEGNVGMSLGRQGGGIRMWIVLQLASLPCHMSVSIECSWPISHRFKPGLTPEQTDRLSERETEKERKERERQLGWRSKSSKFSSASSWWCLSFPPPRWCL